MTIRLETDRLILRDVDLEKDLDGWTDMMSDPETVRFIGGETMDQAASWRQMALVLGHQQARGYSFYSVVEKSSGKFIGRIGHWNPVGWPEPEIGWTLHRDYTGNGYAKEAGKACIEFAFDKLGWKRVIHVIGEENIASIKTAEAIGSQRLYKVDKLPPFGDVQCWAYGQERS